MNEYFTIKEILNNTTLTRRLITLRVNKLKNTHPQLITGGMQGKKYKIHYSLLEKICRRKNSLNNISLKSKEYHRIKKREEILFRNTDWTYFVTINIASDKFDDDYLINLIPNNIYSYLFYSIHYSPDKVKENRHIHLVIKTKIGRGELKNIIIKSIGNSVAEKFIDYFDDKLRNDCYNYFTNDKPYKFAKPSQKVSSYGLIEGKEEVNTNFIPPPARVYNLT